MRKMGAAFLSADQLDSRPLDSGLRKGETLMYDGLWKKLESILDAHSIVNDREVIMNELIDVVNEVYDEAYDKGRCDGSYFGEEDGEWED